MSIDTTISDSLNERAEFKSLITRATQAIERAVGRYSSIIRADWDIARDTRLGDLIRLNLRAWTGEVDTVFTPDELASYIRVDNKVYRLWGDLLGIRSRVLLEELKALPEEGMLV